MRGKVSRSIVALTVAILCAALLTACGSGQSGTTGTSTAGESSSQTGAANTGSKSRPSESDADQAAKLRASILSFGTEGSPAERKEAAAVVREFVAARARVDGPTACSLVSKELAEVFSSQTGRCADGFEKFTGLASDADLSEPAVVRDVSSLRRRGKRVFLIYSAAEGGEYAMLMRPERGIWTIAEAAPTSLSDYQ